MHNTGKVKVGIAGKLNPKINIWGNRGTQIGYEEYSNTSEMLSIKYNF